jgi:hypothetical protein
MSLNVLIVAEDYRDDQYILKPLVTSLLDAIEKPNATVRMCRDPFVRGVDEVLKEETIQAVIQDNQLVDLYLLIVDRDGDEREKSGRLRAREDDAEAVLRTDQQLLGEQAHQEIEVWLLAAQDDLPNDWSWTNVRAEPDPKEFYYDPYAEEKGIADRNPAGGRELLGRAIPGNYPRVRQLCEEVATLEDRVRAEVT